MPFANGFVISGIDREDRSGGSVSSAGKDIFDGGEGQDLFVLAAGEGRDIIQDFNIGADTIGLADGIDFDDLNFDGRNIIFNNQILASIQFNTSRLSESDFTTV